MESWDMGIIGTSYTLPHHLPFKDGLSWAAYEFLQHQCNSSNTEEVGISIIPAGITYTTKNKWRSDVVVEQVLKIDLTLCTFFLLTPNSMQIRRAHTYHSA